jgi:hypothetical protein
MLSRVTAIVVCCLPLGGCFSSVRVSRSDSLSQPPKGIPFYAKTGVCKQETVWLEPQYTLTYDSGSGLAADKILNRQQFLKANVQSFLENPGSPAQWKSEVVAERGPALVDETADMEIRTQESAGNWWKVSNTGTVETVVDYRNVFYLNSARPLAGTTQVDAKLAADGTLTEGSVQVNDQTLATVAAAISSLVSSAASVAKLTAGDGHTPAKVTVKTRVLRHTHSQYAVKTDPQTKLVTADGPGICMAVTQGVYGGSFSVTEATDAANPKAGGGEKDKTISISGSIVLPKDSATDTAKPPTPASGTSPHP